MWSRRGLIKFSEIEISVKRNFRISILGFGIKVCENFHKYFGLFGLEQRWPVEAIFNTLWKR